MTKEKNIPILTLREAVLYSKETGSFTWLERPVWHFKNDAKWSAHDAQRRWNARYAGTPAFTTPDQNGYMTGVLDNSRLLAHRAAWAWVVGEWPTETIDHKNRNPADNIWTNLRAASRTEQSRNTKPRNGTSKYKGVSYRKERGVWRANIFINSRQTFLGSFATEIEAAKAYDAAARHHHGRFAVLNFP